MEILPEGAESTLLLPPTIVLLPNRFAAIFCAASFALSGTENHIGDNRSALSDCNVAAYNSVSINIRNPSHQCCTLDSLGNAGDVTRLVLQQHK